MKLGKRLAALAVMVTMTSALAITASAVPSDTYSTTFKGHTVRAYVFCNNAEGYSMGASTSYDYTGNEVQTYVTLSVVDTATGDGLNRPIRVAGHKTDSATLAYTTAVVDPIPITLYSAHEVIYDNGDAWSKYLEIQAKP